MIQIGEILKQVPFFRSLGRDSIDFITEKLKFKQFKASSTICKIDDPGWNTYIVAKKQPPTEGSKDAKRAAKRAKST